MELKAALRQLESERRTSAELRDALKFAIDQARRDGEQIGWLKAEVQRLRAALRGEGEG